MYHPVERILHTSCGALAGINKLLWETLTQLHLPCHIVWGFLLTGITKAVISAILSVG